MIPTGGVILLWRLERGLSQKELADRAGLARPTISAIEQGSREITLTTLKKIATALGISPGTLADGQPPERYRRRSWSRQSLDRLARSLAGEKIRLNAVEEEAACVLRPLVFGLTSGRPRRRGIRREFQSLLAAKCLLGDPVIKNILSRLVKRGRLDQ